MAEKKLEMGMLPNVDNILDLEPGGQRIIIKPNAKYELQSKGGVYLPDTHAETMRQTTLSQGEIVCVGDNLNNPKTKLGASVFFFWPEGEGMFKSGDTIYILLQEYGIRSYLKTPTLAVESTGELTEGNKAV